MATTPTFKLSDEVLYALEENTSSMPFTNASQIPALQGMLGLSQSGYGDAVTQSVYNELDPSKSTTTNRYKVLAMAYAVSKTGNAGYDYGTQFIKANTTPSLEEKLATEARIIAVPLYRNWLETIIAEYAVDPDRMNLLELWDDVSFCEGFVQRCLDPAFINNELIAIYLGGARDFAAAVAYIFERCRTRLLRADTTSPASELARTCARDHWQPFAEQHPGFQNNQDELETFLDKAYPLQWSDEELLQPPSFQEIGDSFNTQFINTGYIHDIAQTASSVRIEQDQDSDQGPVTKITYGGDLVDWMNRMANNGYGDVFNQGQPEINYNQAPQDHGWYNDNWDSFGTCFAPGTMIRTASEDKPIEELRPGERILSKAPNTYGILSTEQVVVPTRPSANGKTQTTRLFGFNHEKPFFTPGHIFFTKAGAKAVKPQIARLENPDIQVNQLSIGDIVFRLSGDSQETKYEEVVVKRFTSQDAECSHVFGLHFRKGDKAGCTYHANGYLVGLNYAETTLTRLRENYAHLSLKEQHKFVEMLPELPPTLRKIFGPCLFKSFEGAFNKPTSQIGSFIETQRSQHKQKTNKRHRHAGSLVQTFPLVHWKRFQESHTKLKSHSPHYKQQIQDINAGERIPEVLISEGAVLVDGELVPHAQVNQREVYWSRPLSNGDWEHGRLETSGDGTFVHGIIAQATNPAPPAPRTGSEDPLPATVNLTKVTPVVGVSRSNDYNLLTTVTGEGGQAQGDGTFTTLQGVTAVKYPSTYQWGAFHRVELGPTMTSKGVVAITATMPDLDKLFQEIKGWAPGDELYTATSTFDSKTFITTVTVDVVAGLEDRLKQILTPTADSPKLPPAFFQFVLKVNMITNVVTGYYSELIPGDNIGSWAAGVYHPLYCPYSPKAVATKTGVLGKIASNPNFEADHNVVAFSAAVPLAAAPPLATAPPAAVQPAPGTNFYSTSANIHLAPSPAVMTTLDAAVADTNDDLPIAYLQTMSTPADADLHSASQTYMIGAASYWRGQDEIDLFGDDRPGIEKTLPDSLKGELSETSQTFLTNHFSKHLLLYSLSNNTDYQSKFDDSRKDKLQFWWTGKTSNCLATQKEYNDLTVITAGQAFMDLADDKFKSYVQSSTDYAQALFAAVTDDDILNNLAMTVIMGDQNLVNRYCAILNALDKQNRALDTKLWQLVRAKQIFTMSSGSPEYGDDWSEFAQEYIKILDDKIAHGDSSISDDMRNEMGIDLAQLKLDLDAQNANDLAFKLFGAGTQVGGNILAVIDQFKRRPSRNAQANFPEFIQNLKDKLDASPNIKITLNALKGILMVGMQAYTVYKSIGFLLNWSTLTPAQRAVGILTVVEATLRGIYDLVQTYKQIRALSADSLDFQLQCVRWSNASARKVKTGDLGDSDWEPILDEDGIAQVARMTDAGTVDPEIPARSMSQQMGESGATVAAEAPEQIAKTFSLSSLVVEGVMVALNIASVVMMGKDLAQDWKDSPDDIKALDTINLIVQCAQVVTGVISLGVMVTGAELSCLPFIGVLVAAAGLIMMLAESFTPRPKPDPVGDYLTAHGYSYIDTLDSSPIPVLTYTTTRSIEGSTLTLDITVSQPSSPAINPPMIDQLLIKVYAGTTATDAFLPPTVDNTSQTVTANNIIWSIVDDNNAFQVQSVNNPDPSDHSLIGRVTPTTKATGTSPDYNPGTSVLGTTTLNIRIVGTLNSALKTMEGQVTEVLFNSPTNIASSDVISKFNVAQ